jgi:hypothetical protein
MARAYRQLTVQHNQSFFLLMPMCGQLYAPRAPHEETALIPERANLNARAHLMPGLPLPAVRDFAHDSRKYRIRGRRALSRADRDFGQQRFGLDDCGIEGGIGLTPSIRGLPHIVIQ